ETELYVAGTKELHNFTINFPLYNGVNSVSVGIDEGAQLLAPPSFRRPGKFVIYGTSITQGGCVSRPGMAYSNILSRKLDAEFVNLGFSGNGRGEPELARLISQVSDIGFIILDYEANAGESITNSLGPFVDILREKHPTTHILIISKIRYANATDGSQAYKSWMANRDFQKNLVSERNKKGDKRIFFLDGSTILGDDYFECTVDGVHPTDLGSLRIADAIQPVIEKILSKSK
ncbi:MAG TPA: SGNH/GDSL hydrolase family protein, partial [Cyclobacteriaceae bacterium]|nr:SGNH/GDSL hydrolase family protein [Cyclobacteriaceae bacterium]